MIKTKTITTDKATLLVVEMLPKIKPETIKVVEGIMYYHDHIGIDGVAVPEGNWQLIGRMPDTTEDQAGKIVDEDNDYGITLYQNYTTTSMRYFDEQISAIESLSSLLQANELYFENSLGSKPTVMDYAPYCHIEGGNTTSRMNDDDWKQYETDLQEWHEAQSKVFDKERTYIFIKVE